MRVKCSRAMVVAWVEGQVDLSDEGVSLLAGPTAEKACMGKAKRRRSLSLGSDRPPLCLDRKEHRDESMGHLTCAGVEIPSGLTPRANQSQMDCQITLGPDHTNRITWTTRPSKHNVEKWWSVHLMTSHHLHGGVGTIVCQMMPLLLPMTVCVGQRTRSNRLTAGWGTFCVRLKP